MNSGKVLVARLDNMGDVLLAGPAVRAVSARSESVVMLAGPRGSAAARMLPGVDEVIVWCAPWIDPEPGPVSEADVDGLVARIRALAPEMALIFTSFHQSALPLALLLRMAGVGWIGAISEEYPGSLLDLRHGVTGDPPEPERALSLARAAGFELPATDDGKPRVHRPLPDMSTMVGARRYLVIHPGVSAPAREWPPDRCAETVEMLVSGGYDVIVTGMPDERKLTHHVAGASGVDLGGMTDLWELAAVLAGAEVVIAPNTGPAHLAAAVGTPVISLFAPVVSAARWAPYGVPRLLLGDQNAVCRNTRARCCPVPGHPCLSQVTAEDVFAAVGEMTGVAACGS